MNRTQFIDAFVKLSGCSVGILLIAGVFLGITKIIQSYIQLRWMDRTLRVTKYYLMALAMTEMLFFASLFLRFGRVAPAVDEFLAWHVFGPLLFFFYLTGNFRDS